jgi:hypothetical protein
VQLSTCSVHSERVLKVTNVPVTASSQVSRRWSERCRCPCACRMRTRHAEFAPVVLDVPEAVAKPSS